MKTASLSRRPVRRTVSVTIKDMPAPLHRELKSRAALRGRSLNTEVLACLEAQTRSQPVDVAELLERARAIRRTLRLDLAPADLQSAKVEGRK